MYNGWIRHNWIWSQTFSSRRWLLQFYRGQTCVVDFCLWDESTVPKSAALVINRFKRSLNIGHPGCRVSSSEVLPPVVYRVPPKHHCYPNSWRFKPLLPLPLCHLLHTFNNSSCFNSTAALSSVPAFITTSLDSLSNLKCLPTSFSVLFSPLPKLYYLPCINRFIGKVSAIVINKKIVRKQLYPAK